MKFGYLLLLLSLMSNAQSNDLYYDELSNLLIADARPNIFNIGANYEMKSIQFQASYTIDKYFFAFSTYNFNKNKSEDKVIIGIGDPVTNENNNFGYSSGIGIQNFGKIGNYENLECLVGYEFQKSSIISYFSNSSQSPDRSEEYLSQKYFKIFGQFNMLRCKNNYDLGFSLKVSYFKFIENPYYTNSKNVFITPSFSFNYKLLKNRSLLLTSQIALSVPTNRFEYTVQSNGSTSYQSNYIIDGNMKIGIQYKFDVKKAFNNN